MTRLSLILLAAAATFSASRASAALLPADFEFAISPYESALDLPSGVSVAHMCGDPMVEIMMHSQPLIKLTNTSSVVFETMAVSIGDTAYHFVDNVTPGVTSDLGADVLSFSFYSDTEQTPAAATIDQHYVGVDFGPAGLAPGESVVFKLQIASDDPNAFPFPDFRQVMLDGGGSLAGLEQMTATLAIETSDPDCFLPHSGFMPLPEELPAIGFGRAAAGLPASTTEFMIAIDDSNLIPEPSALGLGILGVATLSRRARSRG